MTGGGDNGDNPYATSSAPPLIGHLIYFLAGALLPSIAYFIFGRQTKQSAAKENLFSNRGNEFDSDDESRDRSDGRQQGLLLDAKSWGVKDSPYKMILCVNKELKMGKGKIAAQCCHAAVGCYKRAVKQCPNAVRAWEFTGCAKVAVVCPSESEMDEIQRNAYNMGMPFCLVEDAGRTQIAAGSRTVLGLGPAPVVVFEGLTSHLKLM